MRRIIGALIVVGAVTLFRHHDVTVRKPPNPAKSAEPNLTTSSRPNHPGLRATTARRSTSVSIPPAYKQDPLRYLSFAPSDSLMLLPGIGPVLAERVASARTGKTLFTRWEELLEIKGIGEKRLHRLRNLAEGPDGSPADPP